MGEKQNRGHTTQNRPKYGLVQHRTKHKHGPDVNILDDIIPEAGAFYIMDRGYLDFGRLYIFHQCLALFITRAKGNFQFRRLYSHPIDNSTGLRCDQTIVLTGFYSWKDYPEKLRRIRYVDKETGQNLVFLTNCFTLPAIIIAQLYKCRWQVELFFKWIKQHLRITAFFGTSENAVKTQVWIALSVYVLVAIIKKQLNLDLNLYTILQILSVTLFEKVSILQVLMEAGYKTDGADSCNQLKNTPSRLQHKQVPPSPKSPANSTRTESVKDVYPFTFAAQASPTHPNSLPSKRKNSSRKLT